MNPESVRRILAEGGVTGHKDSVWLLDFWGKKTVAGILLMPVTRHQILHLNDSMKLKEKVAMTQTTKCKEKTNIGGGPYTDRRV
jgi:hypothetical protein